MIADVVLDYHYEVDIDTLQKALSESDMLAQWIWDNNFKAEEGYEFEFTSEPNEWWDGFVTGVVLTGDEFNKLVYKWNRQVKKLSLNGH